MNPMKKALTVLLLLVFTLGAKPNVNPREDGAYGRAGRPVWGQTEFIAAAGEFIPSNVGAVVITALGGVDAPKLFHYGTIVMVTCNVDALAFFAQDSGVTTATTGAVTDSASTAGRTTGANGIWLEAGVTRHLVVPNPPRGGSEIATSESQVSVRDLSCASTNSTVGFATFGRPCDVADDCYHGSNATCDDTNGLPRGSYLKLHPTAAAQCSVEVEY